MQKTTASDSILLNRITLSTEELMDVLSCGRATAVEIGTKAKARLEIGKRVLWSVDKVRAYVNSIAQ